MNVNEKTVVLAFFISRRRKEGVKGYREGVRRRTSEMSFCNGHVECSRRAIGDRKYMCDRGEVLYFLVLQVLMSPLLEVY